MTEIIETYWNVNGDHSPVSIALSIERIETYWNVNERNRKKK